MFARLGLMAFAAWAGLVAGVRADDLPPPTKGQIDFESQVRPILEASCLKCHSRGKLMGGFSLETREAILQGGEEGGDVVLGKSDESLLIELVAGIDPDRRMPNRGKALTDEQVGTLRAWIDQGMSWPEGFTFGFRRAELAPRKPDVPTIDPKLKLENPVDRFIALALEQQETRVDWSPAPDRAFARRVSLDLTGLLPTPEQLEAYEKDSLPDKQNRLVERLLSDRRAYADHWLTFWNDALRNAYRGAGFIDGGRQTITKWLYESLYENKPYDQFVHELISPVPGSEGFTKGIIWRGVVNASQVPAVQAAQNVSQVFLGTNLKCASCHDSFVNHWKLADSYALAAVFSEGPLEINRCDKPTGKMASIGFIYPELGTINPAASRAERMKQLADLVVKPEDGRFARTIVNRLWAHLMGRGIVEPLDDMDQSPWSQDLLDWLADDLVAHGYDLKHTLAQIAESRAYRLRSVGVAPPTAQEEYVFRGPLTKRMNAEQFADAVSTLTGVWQTASNDLMQVDGRGQGGQLAAARAAIAAVDRPKPTDGTPAIQVDAQWIWNHGDPLRDPGGQIAIRKVIHLDKVPEKAVALATCDNEMVLFVNGTQVGQSEDWNKPISVDVTRFLKVGDNVIAAEATNWPDPDHNKGISIKGANPAAFIAWVGGLENEKLAWGVGSDATWLWIKKPAGDWKGQPYDTAGWQHSVEFPGAKGLYGNSVNLAALAASRSQDAPDNAPLRASLDFDDPLMTALGRTSRDHVVTRRDSVATTLQALELTNGSTLDATLKQGAQAWVQRSGNDPRSLVQSLFNAAFGRSPTNEERELAADLVGSPATVDGVQDLLWVLTMLPEFQLIN